MRLLAIVHKYPPIHNAGAEWMLHAILRDFVGRGHEATVVFPGAPNPFRLDGVLVASTEAAANLHGLALEHDAIVTHLDQTERAVRTAQSAGLPLVHVVHNDRQLQFHRVQPGPDVLVVPNSYWIDATIAPAYRRVVVRPRVELERYEAPLGLERELVTLINLTTAKGAVRFYELAEAMPERGFLAVAGAYGVQTTDRAARIPNVDVVENTPDIVGEVYSRTRVLLMPSEYESWGRVAIEAACSGIPTIASPTPGLLEALGHAGIFAGPSTSEWRRALRELDDPDVYAEASARARARAEELDRLTLADHDALERAILELLEDHRARSGEAYSSPRTMTQTTALARRVKCPLCGAAGCVCAPDAVTVYDSLEVNIYEPAPDRRGPVSVVRTYQGDFRLSKAHAIELGYAADPEDRYLPPAARRRLEALLEPNDFAKLHSLYVSATPASRDAFMAELALTGNVYVAERLSLYEELLEKDPTPPAPAPDELETKAADVLAGRVGDVEAWVGDDPDRAELALELERAGKKRSTLIAALERITGP